MSFKLVFGIVMTFLLAVNAVVCLVGIFHFDGAFLSSISGGASVAWGNAAFKQFDGVVRDWEQR